MCDLLVIDDSETWQEIIVATVDGVYSCDVATTYKEAIEKIHAGKYRVVCMNWNFHSINNGRNLLILLKANYWNVPIVLITGAFVGRLSTVQRALSEIRSNYPNVKEILIKGSDSDFVSDLTDTVHRLLAGSPVPTVFSWLHLSDLHIGRNENNQDWAALKEALLNDIREHQETASGQSERLAGIVFQPDMIFITGDIAYRGTGGEYRKAEELIESLWEATGLEKERTFIVPGNHDVDRKAVEEDPVFETVYRELADQGLNAQVWLQKVNRWWNHPYLRELWKKKFSQCLQFLNKCTAVTTDLGHYAKSISIPGGKLDIIGLNSALMSWKHNEDIERGLWIGKPQLDEVEESLSENASLRVALVHHPREALHYQDVAWERLQRISHLVLHGHKHELRAIPMGEPEREHFCLPGGSIHQGGVWHSQRYSYGQFDLQTRRLDLFMRVTKPCAYPEYIRDTQTYHRAAPNGHLQIILPEKSGQDSRIW